jgi:two-component system phosphate regulon sensor histidine kinase PhoR
MTETFPSTNIGDIRDVFSTLADGVLITNADGLIEWSNQATGYLLGVYFPQNKGEKLSELISDWEFNKFFDKEDYQAPLEFNSPRNNSINLQVQVSVMAGGGHFIFVRDVTHTHKLESLRRDFVANVSHELKTPLTVINGYLETFADHDRGGDPQWTRSLRQMLDQARRMNSLISDLLLLSRLETVSTLADQESIALRPMLELICNEARSTVTGQRFINLECDDSMTLLGNPDELRSAFTNLVVNAVKYTDDDDSITVRWYLNDQWGCFEVADSGIGIDPKHIPRLTERFYRVDKSRSVGTGGTGLGLAIVKHVLMRHQAQLSIESIPEAGSLFRCEFPLFRTRQAS